MPRGGKREGAGRKPSPNSNKIPVTIRVDPAIAQWLQAKAEEKNLSRSQFTENIIKEKKMQNFELLSGVFIGRVVDDGGAILDAPYKDLDEDLQTRIKYHAGLEENEDFPSEEEAENAKESYEQSWDAEETDQEVDLIPVSEW